MICRVNTGYFASLSLDGCTVLRNDDHSLLLESLSSSDSCEVTLPRFCGIAGLPDCPLLIGIECWEFLKYWILGVLIPSVSLKPRGVSFTLMVSDTISMRMAHFHEDGPVAPISTQTPLWKS